MRSWLFVLTLIFASNVSAADGPRFASFETETTLNMSRNSDGERTFYVSIQTDGVLGIYVFPGYDSIGGYIRVYDQSDRLVAQTRISRTNTPAIGYVSLFDPLCYEVIGDRGFCTTYWYYGAPATYALTPTASAGGDQNSYYAIFTGDKNFSLSSRSSVESGNPDIFAIKKNGSSGKTEVHRLEGDDGYHSFSLQIATALNRTGSDGLWMFSLGDYNNDGIEDLYCILKEGASGKTEVHVLDGADRFQTFLTHRATLLRPTGRDQAWMYDLADYNGDGTLDLHVIKRQSVSNKTEVHVIDGADGFNSYLLNTTTALHETGDDGAWDFALGNYNDDGIVDLYVVKKNGSSGRTEVHVLDGATKFKSFLLHRATPLGKTGASLVWSFDVADFDSDGSPDLYAINRQGGSAGKTDVHVLSGANDFQSYLIRSATALGRSGTDGSWEFLLSP